MALSSMFTANRQELLRFGGSSELVRVRSPRPCSMIFSTEGEEEEEEEREQEREEMQEAYGEFSRGRVSFLKSKMGDTCEMTCKASSLKCSSRWSLSSHSRW